MVFIKALSKISKEEKLILFSGLAIAIATLPICATVIVANVRGINYSDEKRQINLLGKSQKIENNLQKTGGEFREKLNKSNDSTVELIDAVNQNKPIGVIKNKAKKVQQDIRAVEVVGEELESTQKEAVELVESAIAP